MPITQLNTADFDYEMMLNVINKAYKGKADITISEYSTTAAPDVKVGSVFDINGAIFIVDTSDITPSGYGGISNSTTFYLYYDEDPGAFIYSSTAPSWNDALQGWYNSNDRAFFSMFKDSGGTLYENKNFLLPQNNLEVANDLTVNNNLAVNGYATFASKRINSDNYLDGSLTEDQIFDKLDPFIPNVDDTMVISGGTHITTDNRFHIISRVFRETSTHMQFRTVFDDSGTGQGLTGVGIDDGDATVHIIQIAW